MTTVAMADDHMILLESLADVINQLPDFQVTIKATSGLTLLEAINRDGPPDILILDMAMPDMNGYETALWMKAHHPQVKILVLSMYGSEHLVIRMLGLGARGYLKKDIHPKDLKEALYRMRDGDDYYIGLDKDSIALLLQRADMDKKTLKKQTLDERELEYICIFCETGTNKLVTDRMNIGIRTGEMMMHSILGKLALENKAELAVYAVRSGLFLLNPTTDWAVIP